MLGVMAGSDDGCNEGVMLGVMAGSDDGCDDGCDEGVMLGVMMGVTNAGCDAGVTGWWKWRQRCERAWIDITECGLVGGTSARRVQQCD